MAAYRKLMFGKLAEQQGDKQKAKASIGQLLTCVTPEQITKQKSLCTSCWHC